MEDFEIQAHNRYVWQSPRKVRLVVNRVRGMNALLADANCSTCAACFAEASCNTAANSAAAAHSPHSPRAKEKRCRLSPAVFRWAPSAIKSTVDAEALNI